MFALVDGNCFYASCERVYRPDLSRSPLVVLSNNDGCVITRTPEAKILGIKMGEPVHQIRHWIKRGGLNIFSSNYELYGDLSRRMMQTVATLVPQIEIYSIDECFANLSGMSAFLDLRQLGLNIRSRVLQWVGIPTCVGIAPTKTLAKFCNHLAKRHAVFKGVVNWCDWSVAIQTRALNSEDVQEIWGIGRQLSQHLKKMGIHSAGDLQRASTTLIRQTFGVTVERTVRELNGQVCIELETTQPDKQNLIRSRSFGRPITELIDIQAALAHHASEAALALREQNSVAYGVGVMLQTNPFNPNDPPYYFNRSVTMSQCSSDARVINQVAQGLLKKGFKTGFKYKKCGILITAIEPKNQPRQQDWLDQISLSEHEQKTLTHGENLMKCIDAINQRFGRSSMTLATERQSTSWMMRREYLSPHYTTRFSDLLQVD